jgi:hypothetical protein
MPIGKHKRRTHPARVGAAFKQAAAMRLRVRGWSYEQIGRKLHPTSDSPARYAYDVISAGLKAVRLESVEEMRDVEVARFDALLKTAFAVLRVSARRNDARAVAATINSIIRVSERRAKLLGLDAPVKYDLLMQETRAMAKTLGVSEVDFVAQMEKVAQEAWGHSRNAG